MNNVFFLGRITKTPEIRQTNGGKDYCRFSLAVDRDKESTDFIPCLCWGDEQCIGRITKRRRSGSNGGKVGFPLQLTGTRSRQTSFPACAGEIMHKTCQVCCKRPAAAGTAERCSPVPIRTLPAVPVIPWMHTYTGLTFCKSPKEQPMLQETSSLWKMMIYPSKEHVKNPEQLRLQRFPAAIEV
jgi:hypothetical protein